MARTSTPISRIYRIHLIEHHFSRVSCWKEKNISVRESDVGIVIFFNVFYVATALNDASNVAIARINTDKCRYGVISALQEKKINVSGLTSSVISNISSDDSFV